MVVEAWQPRLNHATRDASHVNPALGTSAKRWSGLSFTCRVPSIGHNAECQCLWGWRRGGGAAAVQTSHQRQLHAPGHADPGGVNCCGHRNSCTRGVSAGHPWVCSSVPWLLWRPTRQSQTNGRAWCITDLHADRSNKVTRHGLDQELLVLFL